MGSSGILWIWLLYRMVIVAGCAAEAPQTYVVHVSKSHMPFAFDTHEQWYASTVKSLQGLEEEKERKIMYNYDQVFHGFATKLSRAQAEALESMEGILDVYPEIVYELHTTHSPTFLGIDGNDGSAWSVSDQAVDVIVSVLDMGVCPETPSFGDEGMSSVPVQWKGECEVGTRFNASHCNKKLIGARFFCNGYEAALGHVNEMKQYRSPSDQDGRGTHTASTAAGSSMPDANLMGYAKGNARGMAERARVAVYKVCCVSGCFSSDILAGLDRALKLGFM